MKIKEAIAWPYTQYLHARNHTAASIRFAYSQITRENFKELMKKIFRQIAKVFKGLGIIAGVPFFGVESLINKRIAPPTNFQVGTVNEALSQEALSQALTRLTKPSCQITRLEIFNPPDSALTFNASGTGSLKQLLPDQIFVENGTLPDALLADLETPTHFYHYEPSSRTYQLKRKIFHLVLPENREDALDMIDRLAAKGEKVVNVYFFRCERSANELRDAMIPLDPQSVFEVIVYNGESADVLHPRLNLSETSVSF